MISMINGLRFSAFFIFLLILSCEYTHSQEKSEYTIFGKVVDQSTKTPLSNAHIVILENNKKLSISNTKVSDQKKNSSSKDKVNISNEKKGTTSDDKGAFELTLKPGNYTLQVSYIGYNTYTEDINLNKDINLKIQLTQSINLLMDIEITAEEEDQQIKQTTTGVERLSSATIKKLPSLLGETDVIKAALFLPGVATTSEGTSAFSVRGGSPDQNLILLDRATVYNASHLLGFFSVFNNDAVRDMKLYKGDIPSRYGGRLSSMMEVNTLDGAEKFSATGGIGLISSRLKLEGVLPNQKTSWLIAGRRSYMDLFLPIIPKDEVKDAKLFFYDINANVSHRFSDDDKLTFRLYNGKDRFGQKFAQIDYGNTTGSITWDHFYNDQFKSSLSLVGTNYFFDMFARFGELKENWKSSLSDFTLRFDNDYFLSDRTTFGFGVTSGIHYFKPGDIDFGQGSSRNPIKVPHNKALEHTAYFMGEQQLNDYFTLKYGLRLSLFQNMGKAKVFSYDKEGEVIDTTYHQQGKIYKTFFSPEPQIGFVYRLPNEASSIKGSFNHNVQYIQLANNSSGGTPLDIWFSAGPNVKPQYAEQLSLGYFHNINGKDYELSAELFYKYFSNVIDFRDHADLLGNEALDGEVLSGKGNAYGLELMAKKNNGALTGWVSYTLSRSERKINGINEGKSYLAPFDRPHNLNIVANYEATKKWSFSLNFVYTTGSPVTYPTGRMEIEGNYIPIYSGRNEYRLPDYHRLDLSATYRPERKNKKWQSEWNFSIYNVYSRHNAWLVQFVQDKNKPGTTYAEMTYLFPIIPSVTYNFNF